MNQQNLMQNDSAFTNMDENETKNLLEKYEIKVPTRITFTDLPARIALEFPVVLKVCDPKILHKTDLGGVVLDIKDSAELQHAFSAMKKRFPTAIFLLEKMEKQGVEFIVGISKDPSFGLTIMLGLGGIYAELYGDVTIRRLPIDEVDAEEMMSALKIAKIFEGFRNIRPSREALKDVLLKASRLSGDLEKKQLYELDLNPVLVRENDAVVLDAKAVFHV